MKQKGFDKFAYDYDEIYGNYKEDVEFYKKISKRTKGKVLEIACGTGRIYLELLKEGVDAYGIDISKKMLSRLKKKALDLNLKPKVYIADMRNFSLNKKFSLIIIPFRSFLHNLTSEDQIKTLKNIKNHLLNGGKLILNFFSPDPMILCKTKDKPKKIKKGTFLIDRTNQLIENFSKRGQKFRSYKLTYVYKKEFELLLMLSGFKKWKIYGGFNFQPLKSFKQEMVWIIER